MPDWGIALNPRSINVSFAAPQVPVLLHAVQLASNYGVTETDTLEGMSKWLGEFNRALTDEQRQFYKIAYWFYGDSLMFDYQTLTFPEFIALLDQLEASVFLADAMRWMSKYAFFPGLETLIADASAYDVFMRQVYADKGDKIWQYKPDEHYAVWKAMQDARTLKDRIVEFLHFAWEKHLSQEWKRTLPMLRESVEAFSQQNFAGMSAGDIVEAVTNRDLRGRDYFESEINNAVRLVFVPSPYLGPYVTWLHDERDGSDLIFYGARLPRNAPRHSADMNRSELLVRLNALADETRLRMLEMLNREDEICAQDFITVLELSQSSASRHLRQLTASGYVTERRRDVAKCYSLNKDRIADTIQALQQLMG